MGVLQRSPEKEMPHEEVTQLAERIATEAHAGQFRRGGVIPYIEHPRAVVSRVGNDIEAVVVAWLHDVIEDTEHTADSLSEAGIPPDLVSAVVLLTKTRETTYEDYLERIASSPIAARVKIADMLSNLSDNPTPKQALGNTQKAYLGSHARARLHSTPDNLRLANRQVKTQNRKSDRTGGSEA